MKSRNLLILAALAIFGSVSAEAAIYYVVPGNEITGKDGKSWQNAITIWDIYNHEALVAKNDANATWKNDDVFFFAGGTYYPTIIAGGKSGRIYRGFIFVGGCDPAKGAITDPKYRPNYRPSETPTIFSGDLNGDGIANPGDAQNLLYMRRGSNLNLDATDQYDLSKATGSNGILAPLRIYGFEFKCTYNSNAFPTSETADALGGWGAVCADQGWIELYNCIIHDNNAEKASGVNIYGSLYRITDCQFYNNQGVQTGPALRININAASRYTRGVVERCSFYNNTISDRFGGAIALTAGEMYLVNSTITGNTAYYEGGGIVSNGSSTADRRLHIINCTIAGNNCTANPSELYTTNAITGAVTNPGSWVGSEIRLANDPNCEIWNSIIVGKQDNGTIAKAPFVIKDTLSGASSKSFKLSYNIIGSMYGLLNGQLPSLDLNSYNYQNAENTWAAVFCAATLKNNGGSTMTVVPNKSYFDNLNKSGKYWPAYVNNANTYAAEIAYHKLFTVTGFTVPDLSVDQRNVKRNSDSEADYSPGAYDFLTNSPNTGINTISISNPRYPTVIYNLAGQKVDKNYRGIVLVIMNNKKYLIYQTGNQIPWY